MEKIKSRDPQKQEIYIWTVVEKTSPHRPDGLNSNRLLFTTQQEVNILHRLSPHHPEADMDTTGPIFRDVYHYGCRVTQVGHIFNLTAMGLVKINMGRVPTTISNEIVDFMCS